MPIAAKLDEWGLPAWFALMVLSFLVWWPLGLVILAFLIGSGRMGCAMHGGSRFESKLARMQEKMDRMRGRMEGRYDWWGSDWRGGSRSSGNRAFDDYKEETLRRLEEEQREFREFLDRLRFSKDRAEFDQFMSERRNRPGPSPQPQG
jgi:Protein of unknown function (DUF2852)